jgi:hypothetical protein
MNGPGERLSFLERPLPPGFQLRAVAVAPGCARAYDATEWRDAIVVVQHGEVELDCLDGSRLRFSRGEALWLAGLPLRALENRGPDPVVLVAVSRQPMSFEPIRGCTW